MTKFDRWWGESFSLLSAGFAIWTIATSHDYARASWYIGFAIWMRQPSKLRSQ